MYIYNDSSPRSRCQNGIVLWYRFSEPPIKQNIKALNTVRGKRLSTQAWNVTHDGESFGEILLNPEFRPVQVRNKAGDELGTCRVAVKHLLICEWPVRGINGQIKYDDKENTGTVTAQR